MLNILILSHKPPYPILDGGCLAMSRLLEDLRSLDKVNKISYHTIETSKHPFDKAAFFKHEHLKVTPHLIQAGQLSLSLVVNQDSDSGRRVQGVPILFTKSLITRVRMRNGQTLVLGVIDKKDKNL